MKGLCRALPSAVAPAVHHVRRHSWRRSGGEPESITAPGYWIPGSRPSAFGDLSASGYKVRVRTLDRFGCRDYHCLTCLLDRLKRVSQVFRGFEIKSGQSELPQSHHDIGGSRSRIWSTSSVSAASCASVTAPSGRRRTKRRIGRERLRIGDAAIRKAGRQLRGQCSISRQIAESDLATGTRTRANSSAAACLFGNVQKAHSQMTASNDPSAKGSRSASAR